LRRYIYRPLQNCSPVRQRQSDASNRRMGEGRTMECALRGTKARGYVVFQERPNGGEKKKETTSQALADPGAGRPFSERRCRLQARTYYEKKKEGHQSRERKQLRRTFERTRHRLPGQGRLRKAARGQDLLEKRPGLQSR